MIKALEVNTSMLCNLDFPNNTILSCFFFFFLIIDLYLLTPAAVEQIFNPIAEFVTAIGITNKAKKQKQNCMFLSCHVCVAEWIDTL